MPEPPAPSTRLPPAGTVQVRPAGSARTRGSAAPAAGARGYSLVETVVGLALAAMLAGLAIPSWRDYLEGYRQLVDAQHLAGSLTHARSEAIRRGYRVNACVSADGAACMDAPDWDAGWIVFEDTNRNGTREAGEPVIRREGPAHRGVSIAGNGPVEHYVSYTSLGHARRPGGALQMGTFVVCKAGRQPLRVILAHSGRVRIERGPDRCP
jgi:type IV fimbrial biogenesis protein FimT